MKLSVLLIFTALISFTSNGYAADDCQKWLDYSRTRGEQSMNAEGIANFQKFLAVIERDVKSRIDREAGDQKMSSEKYLSADESVMTLVSQVAAARDPEHFREGDLFCEALRLQMRLKIQSEQKFIAPSLLLQTESIAEGIIELFRSLKLRIGA